MEHPTVPAPRFDVSEADALERTEAFAAAMALRRTIRDFSERPVPLEVVDRSRR